MPFYNFFDCVYFLDAMVHSKLFLCRVTEMFISLVEPPKENNKVIYHMTLNNITFGDA